MVVGFRVFVLFVVIPPDSCRMFAAPGGRDLRARPIRVRREHVVEARQMLTAT